jgi:hypothetical protein
MIQGTGGGWAGREKDVFALGLTELEAFMK